MIVCFALGNSDDKLSQQVWSEFVVDAYRMVGEVVKTGAQVHFAGFSAPDVPWQNALWAIEMPADAPWLIGQLRSALADLAGRYGQDSIAWWTAEKTEFIAPAVVD